VYEVKPTIGTPSEKLYIAPPDVMAASAVLRQLHPPHRIVTILEGESLLNDATALLIYRLAVVVAAAHAFSLDAVGPAFLLGVAGSLAAGLVLGRLVLYVMVPVDHIPTSIILDSGREPGIPAASQAVQSA
jgi:NhaP-type Na+/H+ or K+/H+ antiporter